MPRPLIVCCLSAIAVVSAAAPAPITPWTEWPVLSVPADSPADVTLRPAVVWRLDCGAEAETVVGRIVAAAPGLAGRTLLVDNQLTNVLVIGPKGEIERTVGQPGEGPGDLPGAWRAFQLDDGRIGVAEGAPAFGILYGGAGKIILLDEAGDPAGRWWAAGDTGTRPISAVRELRCAGNVVLTATMRGEMAPGSFTSVLEMSLLHQPDGARELIARLLNEDKMSSRKINEGDYYEPFAGGRCDLSAKGQVAFAPDRDRWFVVVREPDGTGRALSREWPAIPRTPAARAEIITVLGGGDGCEALPDHPALGRIRWRPNGNLWVEPMGVEPAPGAFACFDEFTPAGELLHRVQLVLPGDPAQDMLAIMEDGRFVLLRGFRPTADEDETTAPQTEVILLAAG